MSKFPECRDMSLVCWAGLLFFRLNIAKRCPYII